MSDIVGHASAERYWEGRWRDEAKRVAEWQAVYEQCDKSRDELHDKLGAALARVAELEGALREVAAILGNAPQERDTK